MNVREIQGFTAPLSEEDLKYLDGLMKPPTIQPDSLAPLLELYSEKGTPPIETPEEPLPCRDNKEFRALEARVTKVLETTKNSLSRTILIGGIEAEAQREFCGTCPIREQCLQWAKDDGDYEGIAGGRVSMASHRPRLLVTPGEAAARPLCKCHDAPMIRSGTDPNGQSSWKCAVRDAENRRKYASTEKGRAKRKERNRRYRQKKTQERLAA